MAKSRTGGYGAEFSANMAKWFHPLCGVLYTQMHSSPTKFEHVDHKQFGAKQVSLKKLNKLNEYDCVTVNMKVLEVSAPEVVGKSKETRSNNR